MNSEKLSTSKTTTSCDKNRNAHSSRKGDTEGARPDVKIHEFLDFLNVSCHVNEMISSNESERSTIKSTASGSSKKKSNVNFKKLADNQLINGLYGHKKNSSSNEVEGRTFAEQLKNLQSPKDSSSKVDIMSQRSEASTPASRFSESWAAWKKSNQSQISTSGAELHPKLKEKLDFVINEGVLDSVLPFICPIKIPSFSPARIKIKPKETHNNKKENAVVPEKSSSTVGEHDKEAAANSACDGMVKLREHRSQTRNGKAQPGTRSHSQNPSYSGSDEYREPEVIIHVCDEVKNTSKDFSCPQSLLVSKMGYFADVTAGQKLDDMDISVHCDIHIFDWLMRWVKHSANEKDNLQRSASSTTLQTTTSLEDGPKLDATNVVPILVSASFLQMEPLFAVCLSFCHARLSEIVRVSTNLSCLNDSITTCLAAMFTNSELEMVRDRKERVTPRLWTKLIQSLCEPEPEALRGHYYSLAGLFRCAKCDKCLTNTMKSYVSCTPSNVRLNRWGQVFSHHLRDAAWDINMFITQLFKEQKSWRKVYWKLWGHCHYLYCCACESHFPVYQMAWCRYHPEGPNFLGPATEGRIAGPTGRYPCCGQQAFRFETLPGPNGCQFREHSVLVETDRERAILSIVQLVSEGNALCEPPPYKLTEALSNGNEMGPRWSSLSLMPQRCRQGLLPVLNPDESFGRLVRRVRGGVAGYFLESSSGSDTSDTLENAPNPSKKRLMHKKFCRSFSTSSDGCESDFSDIKAKNSKKGRRKRHTDTPGRNWSGELSARSNQDNQREFEEKVMKQVIAIVSKKIGSDHLASQNSAPIGGTYVRLEAEWREQAKQKNISNSSNCAGSSGQHTTALSSSATTSAAGATGSKQRNK